MLLMKKMNKKVKKQVEKEEKLYENMICKSMEGW